MGSTTNASAEYLKGAVLSASSEQLQLMLIEGAIRFARRASEAIRAKNYEQSYFALDRAQRIVLQLVAGLRREINPQVADQMTALFEFIHGKLVEANLTREIAHIEDAIKILEHQRGTWELIVEKIQREIPDRRTVPSGVARSGEDDDGDWPALCLEG